MKPMPIYQKLQWPLEAGSKSKSIPTESHFKKHQTSEHITLLLDFVNTLI